LRARTRVIGELWGTRGLDPLYLYLPVEEVPPRRLRDGVRQQGYYPSKLLLPLEAMSALPSRGLLSPEAVVPLKVTTP